MRRKEFICLILPHHSPLVKEGRTGIQTGYELTQGLAQRSARGGAYALLLTACSASSGPPTHRLHHPQWAGPSPKYSTGLPKAPSYGEMLSIEVAISQMTLSSVKVA